MKYILQGKFNTCYIKVEYIGDYVANTRLTSDITQATIFTSKAEAQRVKVLSKYHNIKSRNFDIVKLEPLTNKTLVKIDGNKRTKYRLRQRKYDVGGHYPGHIKEKQTI